MRQLFSATEEGQIRLLMCLGFPRDQVLLELIRAAWSTQEAADSLTGAPTWPEPEPSPGADLPARPPGTWSDARGSDGGPAGAPG